MKDELRKGFNYQRAYEDTMRQLSVYIEQLQETGKEFARGLLKDLVKKGVFTEAEAKQIATDLKI